MHPNIREVVSQPPFHLPPHLSAPTACPPLEITSCTGDRSSSTIAVTPLFPTARCNPSIPGPPNTSVRPSTAAFPT